MLITVSQHPQITSSLFGLFIWIPVVATATEEQQTTELETIEVHGQQDNQQQEHLDETFLESFTRDKLIGEDLKKEMVPDVKSALRDVPNVSVTDSGAFSKRVEIRGLSGDRITYLVDDVAIANQGMTHSGGGEINLMDINKVDSIEVIKGSPSVIYSPGATGGVVSVVTKEVKTHPHLNGSINAGYDSGYAQDKEAVEISAGMKGVGISLSASRTHARDYNIRDQNKLNEVILRTNELEERLDTADEIKDLGYSSESYGLQMKYDVNQYHSLTAQHTDYIAKDISLTHGAATDRVFHYDEYSRTASQIGYQFENSGNSKANINLYKQKLIKDIRSNATLNRTQLDSRGFHLKGSLFFNHSILRVGAEYVSDEAETNTFSEQDYFAAYANYEISQGERWTYVAGLRANRWEVEQQLKPGQNTDVAADLAGISGKIEPQSDNALTYAAGVIYAASDNHNLSFNYSHTHRYPTLMERFAFDSFVGGGLALEAESADNIELGWKYNNGVWYAAASLFYSRFDNYITTKQVRRLTDNAGLQSCIAKGDCDPATGHYDDRESDFFDIKVHYMNVSQVDNRGFEFSLKKIVDKQMEAGLSFGFNDFSSEDLDFITDSRPLEVKAYYKKYFLSLPTSPWLKLKMRYVTNEPAVEQKEGFSPFLVADVYAGGEYKSLNFSIGIRNVFNKVYHEPYSALDGVERSFFATVSYDFD